MKKKPRSLSLLVAAAAAFAAVVLAAGANAKALSAEELHRRTVERRAVEAVIWGMPAVNYQLMYEAMVRASKGGFNQIVYWSGLPDWKNQTLTPNPDAIYLMPFIDTKDAGPMVIEIPPADEGSITGTIMDSWQTPLADVGPAGTDAGKGGKYLIMPPDYKDPPPDGYIALPSITDCGYALLRSILKSGSDADIAKAIAYGKRIKVYPLAAAASPPPTTFVDALGILYDATIPYDIHFFQALDRFVQGERWLTRDKAMIDQLAFLGIVKGKPFAPDAATKTSLGSAALEAHAFFEQAYATRFTPYYTGSHWILPVPQQFIKAAQGGYSAPEQYPVDDRGLIFTFAFFTPKQSGGGSFYLMDIFDQAGKPFEGSKTYRLTVPANAPVSQYWSATVYDRETHALLRNQSTVSRSSLNPGLKKNADGSVDVYFGPKASAGEASNWVPTTPGGKFEVLFRFYGPQKPLYDKTWTLPDIERVK